VQFQVDGTNLDFPIVLQDGIAQISTSVVSAGQHKITAFFTSSSTSFDNSDDSTKALNQTAAPAPLTVTANNQNIVFGSPSPPLTVTYSGFVNGETQAILAGTPDLSTTAKAGSNVGNYPISMKQGTLSDPNYSFSFVNGKLTITPAPLTITGDSKLILMNAPLPALTASYSGSITGQLTKPPTLSTTAVVGSPAGVYPIVPSGAEDPNYQFTYANGVLNLLTVTTRHLQRVLDSQSGVPLTLAANPTLIGTDLTAINGLPPQSTPLRITLNLANGNYPDLTVAPPAGVTLILNGRGATVSGNFSGSYILNVNGATSASNPVPVSPSGSHYHLTSTTPSPSFFDAALSLLIDGFFMIFDSFVGNTEALAAVNANIPFNSPYAGPFAEWFVLLGEEVCVQQMGRILTPADLVLSNFSL
jgi:hypothetical protein